MPKLSQHQSNEFTKMLIEGDSSSGKTGALASLVKAGYKLFILDWDNGLEPLKQFVLRDSPDRIDNIEYRTLQDKRKATPAGMFLDGPPKAFIAGIKMLDRWKYTLDDGTEVDYGVPAEWGPDCILVIDSLTFMAEAAFDWREPLTPKGKSGDYDKRAVYGDSQDAISDVLKTLNSDNFRTNVIVITHIRYVDNPDGTRKGYPSAVGAALSPQIPRFFNTVALCQTQAGGKRTIQTEATAMIDLKNPKPFAASKSYPIETGLADFFSVLREPPKVKNEVKSEPEIKPVVKSVMAKFGR